MEYSSGVLDITWTLCYKSKNPLTSQLKQPYVGDFFL